MRDRLQVHCKRLPAVAAPWGGGAGDGGVGGDGGGGGGDNGGGGGGGGDGDGGGGSGGGGDGGGGDGGGEGGGGAVEPSDFARSLAKVGRCRLTVSKPVLKAPVGSARETIIS